MKRSLNLAQALFGAILCLYSCQKAPELTINSSSNIELASDGSSESIMFTANRDWTANASDSWVTISPSSGTASDKPITITVHGNANTTYDNRTATIAIHMEELSQMVVVRQPANLGIVLSTWLYELASNAQTIEISVQSNVQYQIELFGDWIRQKGTKGLVTDKLCFDVEENKTYDAREGTITIKANQGNMTEQVIAVKQNAKPIPAGAVDLGMVITRDDGSSYRLFWAECNLGASMPEEYGDYFAWGEVEPKTEYSWANYKWGNYYKNSLTKYNNESSRGYVDNKMVLDPEDDAAHVILGKNWRMPTIEELYELNASGKFNRTWTTQNGVIGNLYTSSINGNSIFLPSSGHREISYSDDSGIGWFYWGSTLNKEYSSYAAWIYANRENKTFELSCWGSRYLGLPIRPVTE